MTVPIYLSMTTHPARNGTLGPTLYSLRMQSRRDAVLVVYGSAECVLPSFSGIRVTTSGRDRGPVTKIAAAVDPMIASDNAIIVTVDDDIIYGHRWLETLIWAAETYPDEAVGFSGWHVDRFKRGEHDYRWARPGPCDVLEGWAGVAYRKAWFKPDVLDPPEDYRLVDDVWISSYLAKRGVARRVIGQGPLAAPAQNAPPGLHDRADFKALNERAALLGFP